MYSEFDIHTETVCDYLMDYFSQHAKELNDPAPTIESLDGDHPISIITATNHDGRRFQITIITEEVD